MNSSARFRQARLSLRVIAHTWLPMLLIAAVVYWLAAVSVPYYLLGLNNMPDRTLFGDHLDTRYLYQSIMGTALTSATLTVWLVFDSVIPVLLLWLGALLGLLHTKRWWILITLLSAAVLFLHIRFGLIWPSDDVAWAIEIIYHD